MLRVPIDLGPVPRVKHIFYRKAVQIFVNGKLPDHIPTNAIDIDPAACGPRRSWLCQKISERIIIKLLLLNSICRKIDNSDTAFLGFLRL